MKNSLIILLLCFFADIYGMKRKLETDLPKNLSTPEGNLIIQNNIQAREFLINLVTKKDVLIEDNLIEKYPDLLTIINDPLDNSQNTALHLALKNSVDIQIICYLINNLNADINKVNKFDVTPLHIAAGNKPESIEILLNKGANIEAKTNNGATPLHYAAQYKPESVEILLNKGANIEAKTNNGATPLHAAAQCKPESIEILLNKGANIEAKTNNGATPLHAAAQCKPESVEILLNKGANIEAKDDIGWTPLHYAAQRKPESIEILLNKGANIEAKANNGTTPLHLAAATKPESIEILLNKGANIEAKDDNIGWTPLHYAAQRKPESIEILLNKGANIEAKANNGATPLHYATAHKPESIEILLNKGANIEAKTNNGATPLHAAINNKNNKSAKILLKNKADFKAKNNSNLNALQLALNANNSGIIYNLIENSNIEFLNNSPHASYFKNLVKLFELTQFLDFENLTIFASKINNASFLSLGEKLNLSLAVKNLSNSANPKKDIIDTFMNLINNEIKQLIKSGLNLSIIDLNDNKLIDYAAKTDNQELILLLLICGAKNNQVSIDYITIKHLIANNHFDLLQQFINKFKN